MLETGTVVELVLPGNEVRPTWHASTSAFLNSCPEYVCLALPAKLSMLHFPSSKAPTRAIILSCSATMQSVRLQELESQVRRADQPGRACTSLHATHLQM